jgi:hypothetical protein
MRSCPDSSEGRRIRLLRASVPIWWLSHAHISPLEKEFFWTTPHHEKSTKKRS